MCDTWSSTVPSVIALGPLDVRDERGREARIKVMRVRLLLLWLLSLVALRTSGLIQGHVGLLRSPTGHVQSNNQLIGPCTSSSSTAHMSFL